MSLGYVVLEELASRVELVEVREFSVEEADEDADAERPASVGVGFGVELVGELVHELRGRDGHAEEADVRVALALHVLVDDAWVSGDYARPR